MKLCTATLPFFFLVLSPVTGVIELTKTRENHLLLVSRLSYPCEGFEELYRPHVMSAGDEKRVGRGHGEHITESSTLILVCHCAMMLSSCSLPIVCWVSFECNAVEVTLALNSKHCYKRKAGRDTVGITSLVVTLLWVDLVLETRKAVWVWQWGACQWFQPFWLPITLP